MKKSLLALSLTSLIGASQLSSQVSVSVNFNIKHEVGGVSDFGRERHITVHSTLGENDWTGEYDKMDYLMNDLDVYFGRDNGSSNWRRITSYNVCYTKLLRFHQWHFYPYHWYWRNSQTSY